MADLSQLVSTSRGAQPGQVEEAAGATLLEVLETAQRLVAYCDNQAAGGSRNAELAALGLPGVKIRHALTDLRRSVLRMNSVLATEDGCALLGRLRAPRPARRIA